MPVNNACIHNNRMALIRRVYFLHASLMAVYSVHMHVADTAYSVHMYVADTEYRVQLYGADTA